MHETIDTQNLNMLKEVIGDGLIEVLDAFIKSAPEYIHKMKTAVAENDLDSLALNSHALKGSAANIGAPQLTQQCAELEQLSKTDSFPSDASSRIESIDAESQKVISHLKEFIQEF
jgi:HPt (histidine-containing phosphotransfer) domain-containing protein